MPTRAAVEEQIAGMPVHAQPPMRELGRRSEAAEHPFRASADKRTSAAQAALPAPPIAAPPIALIDKVGRREEVVAACAAASALGIHVGMAATHARALVSDLDFRPADHAADATLLDRLALFAVRRWSPVAAVIDAFAATLPLCRTMERTRNSLLLQRSQLQCWIDRGRSDESNTGAGHIRWGKAIKGLVGKLGEITVRHVGPAPGRGHLVRVEIGPGSLATGYVTPTGDLLEPELVVSNKANLRREMAAALRAFCGATRLT